jgi:hypothetical protein
MHARRLRDWFVEAKLYVSRTSGYLSILNFLMIALVFLNTTVWDYAPVQHAFGTRMNFILSGFVAVMALTILIGYVDTKLKLWRTESEKTLTPERSPQFVPIAFQCAKMLGDMKKQGKDTKEVEASLDEIFARCKLTKEFEFFKEKAK